MTITEAILDITKAFGVGTIRTWANGKKYQKQANGKWVEVKTSNQSQPEKSDKEEKSKKPNKFYLKGETDLLKLTHERAYIYGDNEKIEHIIDGNEKTISFTDEQLSVMKGKVFTHNHPSFLKKEGYAKEHGNSFSKQDIFLAFNCNLKEMRAVAGDYIYSFKRKDGRNIGEYFDKQDLATDIFISDMNVRNELEPLVMSGKITIEEANYSHWHKVWEEYTMKNTDFEYTKTKAV